MNELETEEFFMLQIDANMRNSNCGGLPPDSPEMICCRDGTGTCRGNIYLPDKPRDKLYK